MSADLTVLNPHQQRRLRATCQYIDNLLSEIEIILGPRDSHPLFPRYAMDMPSSQRLHIEGGIAQLRQRMLHALTQNGLGLEPGSIPASQAIRSTLNFIDVAITELRPEHMRGYGAMSPEITARMSATVDELEALLRRLDALVIGAPDAANSRADKP